VGEVASPVALLVTGLAPDLRFRTKGQLDIDIRTNCRAESKSAMYPLQGQPVRAEALAEGIYAGRVMFYEAV
jgi:hypothetical protein